MQVWPASYKTRNGNGETKRNETKRNRNKTKVQGAVCTCAFWSLCARLSEREGLICQSLCEYKQTVKMNSYFSWRRSSQWSPAAAAAKACVQASEVVIIEMQAHLLIMSFLFARSSICTIMLWQEDSSHLAQWMFTTTPIFHAPVSDVSPLTLLRLKFQKKLGPNYRLNNDYFLSGPLGLTSIFFVFVAIKVVMDGFVHLTFSVTELVQCYCGVPLNHWRKTACK